MDHALAGLIVVGIIAGAIGLVWPLVWLVEWAVFLAERAYCSLRSRRPMT